MHAGKELCPGNCVARPALPGYGATRVEAKPLISSWPPVYDRFTEGFGMADLKAASTLIADLRASNPRLVS